MKYLASKIHTAAIFSIFAVVMTVAAPSPGFAQDLTREIERLQRDMADLQRFVYAGKELPPSSSASAASADTVTSGSQELPPDVAGRMQVRFQQLEDQMRGLTGRLEEIQFAIRQTEQRVEKLAEDLEFRLDQLEQQVGSSPVARNQQQNQPGQLHPGQIVAGADTALGQGATAQSDNVTSADFGGTTVISSAGAEGPGAEGLSQDSGASAGRAPRSLGSLTLNQSGEITGGTVNPDARVTAEEIARQPTEPTPPSTVESAGSVASVSSGGEALPDEPKALYEHALTLLLRKRDYVAAQSALETYIDRYPNEELVGAATYWLGESHYVRQNYRDAAFAFVDVYSKYPKSTKVADSLLKLGMSLQALGQTSDACTALETLKQDYSDAKKTVLTIADQKLKEFKCP